MTRQREISAADKLASSHSQVRFHLVKSRSNLCFRPNFSTRFDLCLKRIFPSLGPF